MNKVLKPGGPGIVIGNDCLSCPNDKVSAKTKKNQGPVVQKFVSLTSSLRPQLV